MKKPALTENGDNVGDMQAKQNKQDPTDIQPKVDGVPEQLEDAGEESEFIPIFEDDPEQLKYAKNQVADINRRMQYVKHHDDGDPRDCAARYMDDVQQIFTSFFSEVIGNVVELRRGQNELLVQTHELLTETKTIRDHINQSTNLASNLSQAIAGAFGARPM